MILLSREENLLFWLLLSLHQLLKRLLSRTKGSFLFYFGMLFLLLFLSILIRLCIFLVLIRLLKILMTFLFGLEVLRPVRLQLLQYR